MKRTNTILLYSIGLFFSGLVVGILLTLYWKPHHHFGPQQPDRMVHILKSELSLRPDQIDQIKPILKKRADSLAQIRSTTTQQAREVFKSTDQEILKILDPKQQEIFEKFRERRSARFTAH